MKKNYFNNYLNKNFSFILFCTGLFLLPSAFVISAIFFLISLLISTFKLREYLYLDKFNISFLIGSLLILLSAFMHSINNQNLVKYDLDISLTWIGLANWLPFLWCFWGFKPFLNDPEKRRICGLILLSGTIPVLLSGLGQVFLNWHGPFSTFFDLIIWYQRPLKEVTGLTGLFNNANYAGSWLNVIWPFSLAFLIDSRKNIFDKISIYAFIFGISLSIILTNSRSSWLGIVIGTILLYGQKSYKIVVTLLIAISIIITATIFPFFGTPVQNITRSLIPESIWMEFSDFQYSRIEIWHKALETIFNHPIFGTGASSFPQIFEFQTGLWKGHAHNLPLELIISYGIPAGLFILIPIFLITYLSIKYILSSRGRKEFSINDQAWITSLVVLLLSQMVDVQYFDGRISIILWVLLSGAKNIIDEKESTSI